LRHKRQRVIPLVTLTFANDRSGHGETLFLTSGVKPKPVSVPNVQAVQPLRFVQADGGTGRFKSSTVQGFNSLAFQSFDYDGSIRSKRLS
jgi:hypothetical protein